jgi:hypothetical protein
MTKWLDFFVNPGPWIVDRATENKGRVKVAALLTSAAARLLK